MFSDWYKRAFNPPTCDVGFMVADIEWILDGMAKSRRCAAHQLCAASLTAVNIFNGQAKVEYPAVHGPKEKVATRFTNLGFGVASSPRGKAVSWATLTWAVTFFAQRR